MEKIKITFLGTADSIPSKLRNHTSILLSYKNENILIDCGEGTQRQFRTASLNPCSITRLLITHWHGDHILGIPGLLQTLALSNYNKTLFICGPRGTKNFISLLLKMFVFEGKIKYEIKEVSNEKIIETKDFYLETFPLIHGPNCNGYSFIEKDRLRIDKKKLQKLKLPNSPLIKKLSEGKDIEYKNKTIKASSLTYMQKGRKVSFVFDTEYSEGIINNVKNADLIVSESTYSKEDNDLAKRYHHLTAPQAAAIAKKAKAKNLVLTHISQRYPNIKSIYEEAKKIFSNTTLAKDLQVIEV